MLLWFRLRRVGITIMIAITITNYEHEHSIFTLNINTQLSTINHQRFQNLRTRV